MNDASPAGTAPRFSSRRIWLFVTCLPLVVACALVPFISLRALGAPLGVGIAVALLAFPALPLLWHALAERRRPLFDGRPGGWVDRLALRSLALALLVLAVSLSNLGARRVGAGLLALLRPAEKAAAPVVKPMAPAVPRPPPRHELEPFIPADARLVLALSDSAVMQQFLAAMGDDAKKKLAALEKCQILIKDALVLIATRDPATRLIAVRAAGITDPRNLYCLVGFLGNQLSLRFTSDKAPVGFEVEGLLPRPMKFKAVDDRTVVMTEGTWADAAGRAPASGSAADGGPLNAVLGRIDRSASIWSASVSSSAGTAGWDLAFDARFEGEQVKVHGSSTPPSGAGDRAELDVRVPLAFASALPAGALHDGLRSLLAAITAVPAADPVGRKAGSGH
jgi:hypothetical protein